MLVISDFDKILETSSLELCKRLISVPNIGLAIDVNYLFDPQNINIVKFLLKSNSMLIPTVSHHISNYVGIVNEISYFQEICGKSQYYKLCTRINLCAAKAGL
jgi:hypothetical protein